jgi:heme-degrading monooxygenase HmoA
MMFAVLFEVQPYRSRWDMYLANAGALRPDLELVEGFVDNLRYRSLMREGWILSLSSWHDEKAVVRWRTAMRHHQVQQEGRNEILHDYHLRVGQVTHDTALPEAYALREQRFDETEIGEGTTVTLLSGERPPQWVNTSRSEVVAEWLGLTPNADDLRSWDVFHTPTQCSYLRTRLKQR